MADPSGIRHPGSSDDGFEVSFAAETEPSVATRSGGEFEVSVAGGTEPSIATRPGGDSEVSVAAETEPSVATRSGGDYEVSSAGGREPSVETRSGGGFKVSAAGGREPSVATRSGGGFKVPAASRREPSIAARSFVNSIAFRNFDKDGSPSVLRRDIEFTSGDTELPEGSRLTLAAADSSFPMAFDNDRFFGPEGYKDLLRQAFEAMAKLSKRNQSWGAPAAEMGFFGLLWRWFVKVAMSWTNDVVNRLRYTRGVQESLPFQTGYESFALGGVIRAYDVDDRTHDRFNLNLAFSNRNTSRILIQMLSRWDWVWHLGTSISWSRLFDFIGLFPFIGFTSFPATENFPASKNHALAGIFRLVF